LYHEYISFDIKGKDIDLKGNSSIYILIKNAKKVNDKKLTLYKHDDAKEKEKDKDGNIIDSKFIFAKNYKFTNSDPDSEIFIKKSDIDALDKQ